MVSVHFSTKNELTPSHFLKNELTPSHFVIARSSLMIVLDTDYMSLLQWSKGTNREDRWCRRTGVGKKDPWCQFIFRRKMN